MTLENSPILFLISSNIFDLNAMEQLIALGYIPFQPTTNVQLDIAYIRGWLKGDAPRKCCYAGRYHSPDWKCWEINKIQSCKECPDYYQYDSGVIGVVLPSAMPTINYIKQTPNPDHYSEYSHIVAQFYEYMKTNHILLISFKNLLNTPKEQWEKKAIL